MKTSSCLYCREPIAGRADKKFCDDQCRSNYHYQQNKQLNTRMNRIHAIHRRNRKVLDSLCNGQYLVADIRALIECGFVTGYNTHVITDSNEELWFVCYDLGLRFLKNNSEVAIKRFSQEIQQ